ncbi:MAG TPA: DUF2141 domain-containing protein [Xanthobacteraceae bacterium]|nr:DUF2141 domain-containing protein [Xanthobacteraceae bacterium]
MTRKIWKLATAASCYALALTAAGAADLTVSVSGIRNASGSVSAGIYNSESTFTKAPEAFALIRIKATPGTIGFTLHDLPPGRYAVAAYHDENGNGRLDFDPTGVPTEGYGVSNNTRNPQAPPEFAKAAFELRDRSKSIAVNIDY